VKPLKLRTRLTVFYGAVFALLLASASTLFYRVLVYQTDKDLREELNERAAALRGYLHIEEGRATLVYDENDPEEAFFIGNATRYYQVYDVQSGEMVVRSPQLEALGFQYTPEEIREVAQGPEFAGLDTEQVELLLHNDIVHARDGRAYLLQVGAPLGPRDVTVDRLLRSTLWILPSGIAVALLAGWWASGRVLRPLASLSTAAREMSIAQLHRRLPVTGAGDELDELAKAFNEMFGRLEVAVQQMKDFTASISHELRTPLTVLRGEAEIALARANSSCDLRRTLESQLEEFAKLSRIIDEMLTLARAEAGQISLRRERVNLSALARSLTEIMEPLAVNRSITLTAEPGADVIVNGDTGWLERAILNILDNAIKYTGAGGQIAVRVTRSPESALLEVRDTGIGITPEALPHIFERFYRGDPSRSKETDGAGLGLSLVEWVVRQHGGQITVESQLGHGTTMRVALPCNETPAEH
jgi:heavy metal sensor kinase